MKRISKANKQKKRVQVTKNQPEKKEKKLIAQNNPFLKLFETKSLLILVTAIFIIGFLAFKDYFLLKYVYFFKDIGSDTLNNVFPAQYLAQQLKEDAFFSTWSFNIGMGQAYFSGIPVLANPFYYFGLLINSVFKALFGENYVIYAKFWNIFINHFFISGVVFYFYLRSISVEKYAAVVGALLVSFVGYAVLGSSWGHSSLVRATVIFLFATEQLIAKKRWYFFPIATLFVISNPFFLYVNTLFIGIYLVFRFFFFKNSKLREYLLNVLKMFALGILGILLSLVNIISNYIRVFNSPRVSGGVGYYEKLSSASAFSTEAKHYGETLGHHLTALYRFFSNDILGNGSYFKGWNNYLEAPVFYAGLITLLLIPQLFVFIDKKKKIALASFISFWALIVIFPFFRYAFNAFTGDYYKIGLDVFIPLSFIVLAVISLNYIYKEAKINSKVLLITLALLLTALYLPDIGESNSVVISSIRNTIALFLVIYTVLLVALKNTSYRNISFVGIFVVLFFELTFSSYKTVNDRQAYSKREFKHSAGGYFDNTIDAVSYLKSIDGAFYRVEKDYWSGTSEHGSLNDAKVQGYYGTTSYSSFNQGNYIRFLQEAGVIEAGNEGQTRWATGLRGQPILSTWGNIKYFFTKNDSSNFLNLGYSKIQKTGDVTILKNNYYLPFGYTYSSYMTLENFRKLSTFQKHIALLNSVIIEKEKTDNLLPEKLNTDSLIGIDENIFGSSFVRYQKYDFAKEVNKEQKSLYAKYRNELVKDTLKITEHGQNFIKGEISLEKPKFLFFTIPYDAGWEAMVNGNKQEILKSNIGFSGLMLPKGEYKIELNYLPPYFNISLWITILSQIAFVGWLILFFIKRRNLLSKN